MTLLLPVLAATGAAFALSGVSLIRGRHGPDGTNPVAGAAFIGVGLFLLVACILVS